MFLTKLAEYFRYGTVLFGHQLVCVGEWQVKLLGQFLAEGGFARTHRPDKDQRFHYGFTMRDLSTSGMLSR